MSVYVDDPIWPYGRMKMCHMVADTTAELYAMAARIRVPARWIQKEGTADEHFDICKSKRAEAIAAGAQPRSTRELCLAWGKRSGPNDRVFKQEPQCNTANQ